MKSVKTVMILAEEKRKRADVLAQQAKDIYTEVSQDWNNIAQRIRDGETSGDPLKDFIATRYFAFDEKTEERFRALQARFKNFQGQYAMLVRVSKERSHAHSDNFVEKTELSVGVLSGDSFILDPPQALFWFPTGGKNAVCYDRFNQNPVYMREGDLTLPLLEDMGLKTSSELQILIGDEEVAGWFEEQRGENYFKVFCGFNAVLGRSVIHPRLSVYLSKKRDEWLKEHDALKAKKVWLEAECKRLKKPGVTDGSVVKMEKEIQEIPERIKAIISEASGWGVNDLDWENATAA
ncbi:MAG: hypothetical protein WCV59_02760 [Parcubacteria group bacterium]|jgi:hypothetical protein